MKVDQSMNTKIGMVGCQYGNNSQRFEIKVSLEIRFSTNCSKLRYTVVLCCGNTLLPLLLCVFSDKNKHKFHELLMFSTSKSEIREVLVHNPKSEIAIRYQNTNHPVQVRKKFFQQVKIWAVSAVSTRRNRRFVLERISKETLISNLRE